MECVKVDIKNKKTIYTTEEIPKIEKDTDVIVKIAYAGICGTDMHIIQGDYEATDGAILGHEMSGTIANVSAKYSHLLAVGDRVVVNPNVCCGICAECKKDLQNFCKGGGAKYALGVGVNGAWAQYCKAHISVVEKLPPGISLQQAALCEPLSCIVHGVNQLPYVRIGSEILIVGAGVIGLLWCSILHLLGHKRVFVSEPNAGRRKILEDLDLGFHYFSPDDLAKYQQENPEWKADLCIDCSGNTKAMQTAISYLAEGATFVIFGVSPPSHTLTLHPFELFKKEITVKGVQINTPSSFKSSVAFVDSMKDRYLKIDKLAIRTFSLAEHEEALKAFASGAYTKIMFKI